MAQRILKNRVFNTKRKPSKADPSLIKLGFTALLYLALIHQTSAQIDQIISEQESKSVVLQCPVNEDKCGKLHSLNWFKGDDRIAAMLLGENNATSVNKDFEERVTVDTSPYRLVIKDLKISDEGTYLCDTTFFIPEETCDNFNGYRVDLRVLVPPSEVFILDAKGDRIENGTTVGPMQERQSLKATCTVKNTRPQPEVGWFRGTKRLTTYSPTHNLNDGLYTSTLELDWTLSRDDLAQDIECRVNSAAILNSIVSTFGVDLQVRPTSIEINGVEHHTVQGSKVVLTCDIHGARPAVNLTWYNSTSIISADENDLTEIRIKAFEKIDGTYHTQSELIFNATRFENDRVFRCEAENIVLQINREKPISSALTLEVLYPPVVKVSPPDMVTNTSEIVLLNCEYVANPASLIQVDWYRNDELLNVNDTDHYQGGNSENVALVIKSTDKDDIGNYSCQLSNTIGKGISEEKINLDVQFVPSVEVQMIPAGPVKESDESNVTLYCNILDANPSVLTKVRWYANSTLLKELPDCEETREDLCHIDPSKLLLESIGRGFFYNYSCEGFNAAGWGPRSEDKELIVHYEPGPATLTHFPLIAVKKKSVIFSCSVDDPGYPDSNRFVAQQAKHIQKITKTQYPPLIDFHTVQALQPQEADIALEAFMLQKQQERLRSNAPSHSYSKNETASASHQVHQLKETHALIDFSLNQSLCTLLTLTTYTSQLQILTLYSDEHKNSISNASALSYSLYRKMGKFSFVAQLVSKPNRYRWLRGGRGPLQDVVTKDWTVEPVGLDSRTNYSCYAYNEGGKGLMATVNLEVHAPPFFIKNLAPYTGILHTSSNATLTCRIECVPRCDIHWQKDGVLIERNNSRYFVKEKYMEASPATGDFESILSVLHFNMPNWPRNKFDIDADNANYSCTSTPNTVGAGIKSATYFSIEYSPDNTTVSENITFVQEDTVPGRLICKSRANPEPSYKWFFKNETIGNGNALIINTAMKRSDNGTYTCLAYNKHGSSRAETVIIVQFTPNCEIERREIDGQDTLICTAFGNPEEADFSWSIKAENETVELLGSGDKKDSLDKSYYILQEGYAIARTYRCVANNTVGSGSFCEFEVAEQLAWWQIWEKTTLIVLVAAILGLLLIVIIICCIIICVCRRRRRQDKYFTEISISATQSVLSYEPVSPQMGGAQPVLDTSAASTAEPLPQNQGTEEQRKWSRGNQKYDTSLTRPNANRLPGSVPKSPPRWPIRPGVMLHVSNDTKENLTVNRMAIKPNSLGNEGRGDQLPAQWGAGLNETKNASNSSLLVVSESRQAGLTPPAVPHQQLASLPLTNESESVPNAPVLLAHLSSKAAEPSTYNKVERILALVFKRARKRSKDCTRDSQRSHVGLLQSIWRSRAYEKNPLPAGAHHRLKGIRCSGSVTYKKDPEKEACNQRIAKAELVAEAHVAINTSNIQEHARSKFQVASSCNQPKEGDHEADRRETLYKEVTERTPNIDACDINASAMQFNQSTYLTSLRNAKQLTPLKGHPPISNLPETVNASCLNCSTSSKSIPPIILKDVQLHDKSSSLGEPLTEPGEYENLPFHGLQTAPNKFSATPTSFNNNTNMEHFVPRSERLHGDISKLSVLHQQPQQTPQHHFTYAHAFSDHEVEKNYSSQYIMHRLPTTYQDNRSFNEPVSAHNELQNVSNVFSKNNPEHFQRDQHKNKNTQISDDATQKINTNSLSDVQLLNDRDQDYQSTYATVERTSLPPNVPNTLLLSTNPFLTSSKSNNYNTVGEDELEGTARGKFSKTTLARDNQFYSLKLSSATKIKKKACNVNCSMGLTTSPSSLTKCKKKHSLAGNKHCLMETTSQPMRHYDYENVANKTTSSQNVVHMDGGRSKLHSISNLATVELHAHPYDKDNTAVVQKKKKHHHRYHQKNDALSAESCAEFPLMEPECISIYRSDSGISNSSYESQLPTALSQHPQSKITKNSSSGSLCRKPIKRNMEAQTGIFPHGDLDQEIKWPKEPALTKSQLKDVGEILAYEPASVPRSATSYNSIRSDVTVLEKKESVEADMSTPKASDQYQLGHQLKHSETPSSVSAKSALEMTTPAKCSEISNHDKQIKWLANNPFLAKNGKSNDSGNNNKGNLRRQTISDPYFHIKRQPYGALAPDNPTRLSEEWQIKNTTSNATSKIAARSNEENNERLLEPRKWLVEKPRLNYVPHKEDFPAQILPEVLKEPLEGVHYDYLVSSRPIRLPLRKHHTFHFQNSQTANGKLHQLRQQLQHHLRDRIKFEQENGFSYCPLQHVFKPISPIPSVTASIEEFKTKKKGELSSSEQEYDHYSKEADDDEDPGYSFCEEESIVDNDNYPTLDNLKSYS
nr:uncharacterized protein LOC108079253 isoform X2 [Drosophila kikkawai]